MVTSWRTLQPYNSVKEGEEDHKTKATFSELSSLKGNAIFQSNHSSYANSFSVGAFGP